MKALLVAQSVTYGICNIPCTGTQQFSWAMLSGEITPVIQYRQQVLQTCKSHKGSEIPGQAEARSLSMHGQTQDGPISDLRLIKLLLAVHKCMQAIQTDPMLCH